MSTKTYGSRGQHNRLEIVDSDYHTHDWYDSKTGLMGSHGEYASDADKRWCGERSREMTHGEWSKGVK